MNKNLEKAEEQIRLLELQLQTKNQELGTLKHQSEEVSKRQQND